MHRLKNKIKSKAHDFVAGRSGSMKSIAYDDQVLIHGRLNIIIREARGLVDRESRLSKLLDRTNVSDPFVQFFLGPANIGKTRVIPNNLNPEWNETFKIDVCHFASQMTFEILDKNQLASKIMGVVVIPTVSLFDGEVHQGWHPLINDNKGDIGKIHLSIQYVSHSSIEMSYEVESYFPMQRNCHVILYQDAHCPAEELDAPVDKKSRSCWKDVMNVIKEAKHIICITGWAFWDQVKLCRDKNGTNESIGDMLIQKANEGVKVYIMIWSEKTSHNSSISKIGNKGIMNTHDMETVNFFRNTRVKCGLASRSLDKDAIRDYLKNEYSTGVFSHHQKCIIADAQASAKQRQLVAFVGGLDLTGGRYDTPNHELFKTLLSEHDGDFLNNNFGNIDRREGPREPWHDIHCQVRGPIAHDVFLNFKERWDKQCKKHGLLDPIDASIINLNARGDTGSEGKHKWNVQLFRSIASDSADFRQERQKYLVNKSTSQVENSISTAYIQMIRNAEHFIYIENQYFMGSAYSWSECTDISCHHTIPREITQKIVNKIYMNQQFCVYVVIPMYPEGNPASPAMQEILFWQTRTIEMMYKHIGEALEKAKLDSNPRDWLMFFCLGKREEKGPWLDELDPPSNENASRLRETLRSPIYVHSKMMIVDDIYIIVGSANINQRSMSGSRDTEIAVGCWQPDLADEEYTPLRGVHKFRLSLWAEHLNIRDKIFLHPQKVTCVKKVRELSEMNLKNYLEGSTTSGHLLQYPIEVLADGSIRHLEHCQEFPDLPQGSNVLGKRSMFIPSGVTT